MDAWLREAEEASQWVEDLESKALNSSVSVSIIHSARSKLLELGAKLDRLESLLRNPPPKPILTDEDLDFRWTLFSDIQLRTRTLARSIYALPCPNPNRFTFQYLHFYFCSGQEMFLLLEVKNSMSELTIMTKICCKPPTPKVNQSCPNLFCQMRRTEFRFNH
ncbi:uncharacterized protein LOC113863234 isoform X1 [Abrus precatorius]|uniref:Uncharacterized protein LOC113863234 isoform X1 n=1 Tax=Abrus precatorius TaxID=3816 RepID=A0A8B8LB96_ABRPR|nr:uncharacterized protein LOC113863234 isoform X1 [Abrus precatorius]